MFANFSTGRSKRSQIVEDVSENKVSWLSVGVTAGKFSVWLDLLFRQVHVDSVLARRHRLNYFFTRSIQPLIGNGCSGTETISVLSWALRVSCWLQRRIEAEGWPPAVTLPSSSGGECRDRERRWENKQAPFEDVKRQRLSSAPAEARACADNSTADWRNRDSVCCGLRCRRVDFRFVLKHIVQNYYNLVGLCLVLLHDRKGQTLTITASCMIPFFWYFRLIGLTTN